MRQDRFKENNFLVSEENYKSLLRSVDWIEGFGLLFVECSPAQGNQLIERIREDLPQKKVEVLHFQEAIEELYDKIAKLPDLDKINVVFIKGLEVSLYEYEETMLKDSDERYKYSWSSVPRILGHLNFQRERFRDDFNICFVFLLPNFAVKYFINRAPDFFDWTSGVFELARDPEAIGEESSRIFLESDYNKYQTLTPQERRKKILEIQSLLEEENQTYKHKADLLLELGDLYKSGNDWETASRRYEEEIARYDKAIELKPDHYWSWYIRGKLLMKLDREEEATASYDKALECQPKDPDFWKAWGKMLYNRKRYEEALASYDKAIKLTTANDYWYWYNRGNALRELERYEEAVTSYDKALKFKADFAKVWKGRGIALKDLGRYEEALASYDKAIELKPDYYQAWDYRGDALRSLDRKEEALASYDKALEIKPDYYYSWNGRGIMLRRLSRYEEAITSCDKAIEYQPKKHIYWFNRGITLNKLGRYEEAVASYDKAIELKPDYYQAWDRRSDVLRRLDRNEEALASYNKALEIKPDYYDSWLGMFNLLLFKLKRYEEVSASTKRLIESQPENTLYWLYIGIELDTLGRYEEAVNSYKKALEMKSEDDIFSRMIRSLVMIKLGRYSEVIVIFNELSYEIIMMIIKSDKPMQTRLIVFLIPIGMGLFFYVGFAAELLGRSLSPIIAFGRRIAQIWKAITGKHNAQKNKSDGPDRPSPS